jgi:hypothetical protein
MPGLAFAGLTIAGVAWGSSVPRPDDPAAEVLTYVQEHASTLRISAFFMLAAAVPLAVWSATAYQRVRALGATAPGAAIALAGGVLASGFAALSGVLGWAASRADESAPAAALLRDLSFVTGGPAFTAFFGLLLAGISVPMLLLGIARPLAVFGLICAVAGELAILNLLTLDLAPTLPIARFGGLIWLIAVSLLLPARRPRRDETVEEVAS